MSAVSQIDPHASAQAQIPHPAPTRGSAWNYALEREGWTSLLVLSDALAALAAVLVALAITDTPDLTAAQYAPLFALPALIPAMLHVRGVYRRRVRIALRALSPMLGAISVAVMVVLAFDEIVLNGVSIGPVIGWTWVLTAILLAGGRCMLALARRQARIKGVAGKPTLIVGAGVVGAPSPSRLDEQPEYGLRPVGFLDADPPRRTTSAVAVPVLGAPDDLAGIAAQRGAEHVVLRVLHRARPRACSRWRERCEELGLEVSLVPRLFESINDRVQLERVGGLPLLRLRQTRPARAGSSRSSTRSTAPIALLGLIVARARARRASRSPCELSSPGPVAVPPAPRRPRRPGLRHAQVPLDGSPRRPTRSSCPPPGIAPRAASRATTGARASGASCAARRSTSCRSSSTCCAGEMSLVGPRPERPEFVDAVRRANSRATTDRHRVKSGHHGLGAGPRPARPDLAGRPRRVGQLLHRELVAGARPQDRSS